MAAGEKNTWCGVRFSFPFKLGMILLNPMAAEEGNKALDLEDWCGGLRWGWLPFQPLVIVAMADLQGKLSDRRRQQMVSST
jgi:hypothetical protein